tara:strand:- start:472 stop:996 length:525 start_codon:yes stop_codon:yes gene_type:complete
MLDKNAPAPTLDAPIPGQSLTAPLGDRPWQKPAKFSTPEQALEFYVDRISQDRQIEQLVDLLELGVPVDTLVDTMQLGGVMEGLHSVDVGIIITPALAEVVKQIGDGAEIDYVFSSEELENTVPTDSEIAVGIRHLNDKPKGILIKEENTQEEPIIEEEVEEQQQPRGLMARRQ